MSNDPLDLLYLDVWVPTPLLSSNNKQFFFSYIVDDFNKYFWLFPLTCKFGVLIMFTQLKVMVENLFCRSIKAIQTDGGGEFIALQKFLCSHGISHRKTCLIYITKMAMLSTNTDKLLTLFSPYLLTLISLLSTKIQLLKHVFLLTVIHLLSTELNLLMIFFFIKYLITSFLKYLGVSVGCTFVLMSHTNFLFNQNLLSLLGIASLISHHGYKLP